MPWSRAVLPKHVAEQKVLEYVPQKIDLGTPEQAMEYVRRKPGSDFRMNEQVQIQTGVDKIEKTTDEERIESRALEMLEDIQKNAYQEAYQLGLDEGRQKAFEDVSAEIKEKMEEFNSLLSTIAELKNEIVAQNESHMVRLLFHMASRLAVTHLEAKDEMIVDVLRQAVSLSQAEENVRVQLHPSQIEFVEELRKQSGREFEFLKKIRFEPNSDIRRGGCIVETNYGEIDARVEERVAQLWEGLSEVLPRVKPRLEG